MLQIPHDKVAVVPMWDPSETEFRGAPGTGMIIRPEAAKKRCTQGVVKYLSKDARDKYGIRIGDHVLFSGYTGTLLNLEGEGYIIILPAKFIVARFTHNDEAFTIPGLFHRDSSGEYFDADYSTVIEFLARALEEQDWYKDLVITVKNPEKEDYDEWR